MSHGHRPGDVDDVQRQSKFAQKRNKCDEPWVYGYDIETKYQSLPLATVEVDKR